MYIYITCGGGGGDCILYDGAHINTTLPGNMTPSYFTFNDPMI